MRIRVEHGYSLYRSRFFPSSWYRADSHGEQCRRWSRGPHRGAAEGVLHQGPRRGGGPRGALRPLQAVAQRRHGFTGMAAAAVSPLVVFQLTPNVRHVCEQVIEPNAMCLSTVGKDGRPSARFVLLKVGL